VAGRRSKGCFASPEDRTGRLLTVSYGCYTGGPQVGDERRGIANRRDTWSSRDETPAAEARRSTADRSCGGVAMFAA